MPAPIRAGVFGMQRTIRRCPPSQRDSVPMVRPAAMLTTSAPNWHRLDPQLGWTLRANRYGVHVEHGERTPVRVNPAGFRDIERFLDKPEGVYRIAVLGDDYSEALDTPLER